MYLRPASILVASFHWALFQDTWLSSILLLLHPPPLRQRTKKSFVTTSNHLVLQKHKFTCHVRNWFDPVANNPEKYPGRTSPEQFRLFFLVDGNERNAVHDEIPLFHPSSSSSSSSRSFSLFFPLKTTRLRTMNFNGDAIKHFAGFVPIFKKERGKRDRTKGRISILNVLMHKDRQRGQRP